MFNRLKQSLLKLHHDERGDIPVGTLLIIALIVLPLLFLLITFRESIVEYFQKEGKEVIEKGKEKKQPVFGE